MRAAYVSVCLCSVHTHTRAHFKFLLIVSQCSPASADFFVTMDLILSFQCISNMRVHVFGEVSLYTYRFFFAITGAVIIFAFSAIFA